MSPKQKSMLYISLMYTLTILSSLVCSIRITKDIDNFILKVISFVLLLIPISEFVIQITQFLLSKLIKTKLIHKMDY